MSPNQLLIKYALRYPLWNVITIVLGFSGALFNGVSTTLIVPVVLSFLGQDVVLQGGPPVIQKIMGMFSGAPEQYRLILMLGAILFAIGLKNVIGYINSLSSGHLARLLVNDLRKEGLRILLEVDLDFYSQIKVGDITNRIGNEVSRTARSVQIIFQLISTTTTILVFVGILLSISWELTLASTFLLSLVILVNQFWIRRSKEFGRTLTEIARIYTSRLIDILTGIRLIKAAGNEEKEYKQLEDLILVREKAEFQSQANSSAIAPVNEMSGIIAVLTILFLGRTFFFQQLEAVSAVLLTYLFILFRLLPVVGQLNGARNGFANASASVESVSDFLRRDNKPFMKNGSLLYSKLEKGIRFENVSFGYPSRSSLVLKNVDLWVPRGTTLALVGASGAGKSTLVDLLPRFYDPTEGRITLDDQDLREFNLRSLRQSMGIVSQDTFLFNDSVRNNIAYGKADATDEDVIEAAKRSNAHEFILQLPQGFDTPLGDRGILLSGGQRQRLAIARALLRNPEILVLDEATSALDTVSERLVQQAIDELSRDRTTIVIAHRLSTVQKADQIAVMDKGSVVELGSHEELLKQGGYYARLCLMQFSEDTQEALKLSKHTAVSKTSYEIRSRLNSMIGSLKLVVDGMAENSEEASELTEEAYYSAVKLLQTLESLEEEAKV
ncbi:MULTISPECIES: ABC transporter ATP-binding protein [Trichocoleus]|uniref:ABC transporter ATP-binding protein/permease n=1 Tax=Trichocoleus desertorum GB2-A4 TaxID=2933944 RepID=A0ABV0J570_9CYAN|nr:ABC transporter ATP-binding protein [Trichocoleus sp. FACHB-46]MBD1861636.1 ABC transporter ATP-binding protein [Trichocoleus sp. FACHB-46]